MDFKQILENRRAINFFDTERNVDDTTLFSILETASLTPSGFNLQPWSVVVLRELEKKKKLQELAWGQSKVSEAPVVLIFLADREGWKSGNHNFDTCWKKMVQSGAMTEDKKAGLQNSMTRLYGYNSEASVAFAVKNTSFFAMNVMNAATQLGIASHPMDGFDMENVRKEFHIPGNYWLPMLLALGYPKPGLELSPAKWRKSVDNIIVSFP